MAAEKAVPKAANFFARRTESVDAAGIAALVQRRTEAVFGRVNVEYIIERATLGITLVESEGGGEILAHASLLDYPAPWSGVEPDSWEQWTAENFTADFRSSPMNTLFLHLFVAREGFQQAAITEILRIVFVAVPMLQYVVIMTPPTTSLGPALQPHFSPWPLVEGVPPPSHLAHISHRHQHFPQLHIHPAQVEDSDDLMSVFKEYSQDITGDYGEYFLAELIESQDTHHKTFVAEVGGHGVGFISVTSEVDLSLLDQCFQLECYHHLRHPAPPTLESDLKSQSVQSIANSDQPPTSSTASLVEEKEAAEGQQDKQVEEGSQSKLSSSSLARLAQIAQATSSKSRLTQSRSKLTTHSRTKPVESGTTAGKSETKGGESGTEVADQKSSSKTKVVISKSKSTTKFAESKTKLAESKTTVVESKATVIESEKSVSPSKSGVEPADSSQSAAAAEEAGEEGESRGDETAELTEAQEKSVREAERARRLAGQSSGVAVQLFAIQDLYEMRSVDLLVAVFQAFPDHDFCLLSLPHTAPEFPLLSHFTRVPGRVGSTLPHELYIMHKCSLLHSFVVRPATTSDLAGVQHLVEGVEGGGCVIGDVVKGVQGGRDGVRDGATPLSAMVAECANQIVGVAIVRREEELLYLRSHYCVEDFVYMSHHRPEEHGRLHHLILSPAFTPLTKHFMKEVMRKGRMTCLYYPLHPSLLPSSHPHKPHTITSALSEMVPVRPRRQVVYPARGRMGVNQPLPQVLEQKQHSFALYHINRKLTLEPKMVVNSRVVVVGVSDTALSLLETLIFCPHLHFTNLTLISPSGLPQSPSFPTSCCSQPLGLSAWLHLVPATLTSINREEQEVMVVSQEEGEEGEEGEERVVPYDHLILTTGLQFTHPPLPTDTSGDIPLVYDANDGLGVSEWAQKHLQPQGQILVYGSGIEAHTAVQSLLSGGAESRFITLIRPHPPEWFGNETVGERVQRSLEGSGVRLVSGLTLSGVVEGGVSLVEGGVSLVEGDRETVFRECQGLIYMDERQVSQQVFTAVNDACLVFDKRLVVDTHHQTSDPAILAAGPLTKFSRYYHSDQWSHSNFSSHEVGQKLAATLLSQLDPTHQEPVATSDPSLLPSYTQPKAIYTILPGGLHYLHVDKPSPSGSVEPLASHPSQGQELVTDTENGYFRLYINQYSQIQTITVLSHQEIETSNYLCLYGLHEKYLNNISSRYTEGLIPDLFTFLRELWACAVFHDRFPDLREEVREMLSQQPPSSPAIEDGGPSTESVEERVRELLNDQQTVSLEDKKEQLLTEFSLSPVKPALQQLLHRYLRYNHHHLPMYSLPDIL